LPWALTLFALVLVLQVGRPCALAAEYHIDLTQTPAGSSDADGGPGGLPGVHSSAGGHGQGKPLPVKTSIRNVSPLLVTPADSVDLEVVLRNVGKEVVLIPAAAGLGWRSGNQDQRGMALVLRLTSADSAEPVDVVLGSAFGSSSVAGSLISLAPDDVLVIRASCALKGTGAWQAAGLRSTKARLSVNVTESRYADDRFEAELSLLGRAASDSEVQWISIY